MGAHFRGRSWQPVRFKVCIARPFLAMHVYREVCACTLCADITVSGRDKIGDRWKVHGSHATPMCVWPCLKQLGPERFNSAIEGLELGIVTHAKISNDDGKRERGNNFLYILLIYTITSYHSKLILIFKCIYYFRLIYTNVKFKRSGVFIKN